MKKLSILLAIIINFTCNAQNDRFSWKGKIISPKGIGVEFAHVQIKTQNEYFLFMSDKNGFVEINYPCHKKSDSISISSIGYETKKIDCIDFKNKQSIIIKPEVYKIKEAVITTRKIITKKLGNRNAFTIQSDQISFNEQQGLYIPNNGITGKIVSVRVYMHDFFEKKWKKRPFRLRLFEGDFPFEKEIVKEKIIASLDKKRGHWVEIDLSNFNIDFPKNGILVAIQALPFEYYKKHGYIKHRVVNGRINSIGIGFTMTSKTRNKIKSYSRYYDKEWKPVEHKRWYYLIQIKVASSD